MEISQDILDSSNRYKINLSRKFVDNKRFASQPRQRQIQNIQSQVYQQFQNEIQNQNDNLKKFKSKLKVRQDYQNQKIDQVDLQQEQGYEQQDLIEKKCLVRSKKKVMEKSKKIKEENKLGQKNKSFENQFQQNNANNQTQTDEDQNQKQQQQQNDKICNTEIDTKEYECIINKKVERIHNKSFKLTESLKNCLLNHKKEKLKLKLPRLELGSKEINQIQVNFYSQNSPLGSLNKNYDFQGINQEDCEQSEFEKILRNPQVQQMYQKVREIKNSAYSNRKRNLSQEYKLRMKSLIDQNPQNFMIPSMPLDPHQIIKNDKYEVIQNQDSYRKQITQLNSVRNEYGKSLVLQPAKRGLFFDFCKPATNKNNEDIIYNNSPYSNLLKYQSFSTNQRISELKKDFSLIDKTTPIDNIISQQNSIQINSNGSSPNKSNILQGNLSLRNSTNKNKLIEMIENEIQLNSLIHSQRNNKE